MVWRTRVSGDMLGLYRRRFAFDRQVRFNPGDTRGRSGRYAAVHVRGGDRVLLPANRGRGPRRSASRYRPLRIVADGPEAGARAGAALSALRATDLSNLRRPGPIQLERAGPGDGRDAAAGDHADHRSVSFRPARLA